jgi:hypothetical protein
MLRNAARPDPLTAGLNVRRDGIGGVDVAWVVEGRGYVITGEPPVVDLILATIRYE